MRGEEYHTMQVRALLIETVAHIDHSRISTGAQHQRTHITLEHSLQYVLYRGSYDWAPSASGLPIRGWRKAERLPSVKRCGRSQPWPNLFVIQG
jgi:hypothetical protein